MNPTGLKRKPFGWYGKKKPREPKTPKTPGAKRTIRTLEELTHSELEDKLDTIISEYVRRSAAGPGGYASCVTCGTPELWKNQDCGHYVSRVFRATRWELKNLGVQCPRCNRFLGGVQHIMRAHLVKQYGEEAIRQVEIAATMQGETRMPREWLIEQIKAWRLKVRDMRKAGVGE